MTSFGQSTLPIHKSHVTERNQINKGVTARKEISEIYESVLLKYSTTTRKCTIDTGNILDILISIECFSLCGNHWPL